MTILKCKMCGGDLQVADNTYGTCDSCGSTMTLPKASDERKANLFNRANHYRRQNEFDKATVAYENILNEDSSDAEAHWGIVLSRYGIEYVEDPVTHLRVPTCHRVQSTSILADADYLQTLQHAPDAYTRSLYEEEAKQISEIQKGILAISNQEKPYDVFICYKETTDGGSRTKDSTIAQDIYYQLTSEGYRVFFAKITLEDKLGHQYEPYIFSALNSAKIMLVIGTKKEYFEAVWVKNEWSRYLAIMKKDRSRLLIPCYRDTDAYDIPEELSYLQSQDMSKVGFIQDILRGIKKVLDTGKTPEKTNAVPAVATTAAPGVDSLMKRGWLFLEDSDWKQANEYFDKVLDIDPEYAPAYVGKLCRDLNVQKENDIANNATPISDNNNYQKAVRFADASYRALVEGYNNIIKDRIAEEKRKEAERKAEAERKENESFLAAISSISQKSSTIEKKNSEIRAKYENDMQKWQAEVREIRRLAENWKSQGKCPHCGGKFEGFLFKSCKCGKKATDPIMLPKEPVKPVYTDSKKDIQHETITLCGRQWLVLDVQSDRALILSKDIIKNMPYHTPNVHIIWSECSVRKYLNEDFYNSLPAMFKKKILEVNNINENNQWYGTNGGNDTKDHIFLLSIAEVVKYFGDSGQLKNRPTKEAYCINDQYNSARIAKIGGLASFWWLRSPGDYSDSASYVDDDGSINMYGDGVYDYDGGVRPALWLNL